MIIVSKDQAGARWDTLPDVLREVLFAEATSDFVWKTCEDEHVPGPKIYTVARLAGYVLFGFLHPEDLAKELRDALRVDIRIANEISGAINNRIFAPIRPEIDKVYQPASSSVPMPMPMGVGPKILEEIRPIVPVGARPSMSVPMPVPAPKPAFSEVGWSKMPAASGLPTPSATAGSMPGITPPNLPLERGGTSVPRPPIVGNLQKTEMGKISMPLPPRPPMMGGIVVKEPLPTSSPSRSASAEQGPWKGEEKSAPAPMPVFMKTDSATTPLVNAPDLSLKSGDRFKASMNPPRPPARPAVIEFGIPPKPQTQFGPSAKPFITPSRIVDYSAQPPEKGRQVTEVTAGSPPKPDNLPKPPVLLVPPVPPPPPAPPMPQK